MALRCLVLVGLAALSGASSLVERAVYGRYPKMKARPAFRLVANVTNSTRDLDPPVHLSYLNAINLPSPYNLIGIGPKNDSRIFYMNGTTDELRAGVGSILSDGGKPRVNQGISINFTSGEACPDRASTVHLDPGIPQYPVQLAPRPNPFTFVNVMDLAICDEEVAYVQQKMRILKYFPYRGDEDRIPKHCVPVRLLPECAQLNVLDANDMADHKHARKVGCYLFVSKIEWRKLSQITALELPTHGPF